ncbi:MAG: hypothetical protein WCO09_00425 [bacterium]
MPPEKQTERHARLKTVSLIILGLIVFIAILSLIIYEGGNLAAGYYRNNHGLFASKHIDDELDSVSEGDADVMRVVDSIGNHINEAIKAGGVFDDKDKDVDSILTTQLSATSTTATSTSITNSDIQYVILSFDGSRSLEMWKETRQFAKDMAGQGKPLHFTYFINPIYLITKETAQKVYQPPRGKMGDSMIGYADSEQDVKDRVEQINLAYNEGNEIGSHNVGHFNGSKWNYDEWLQESNSFDSIVNNVQKNNPNVLIQPWTFNLSEVAGFRAPELGVNNDLYKVLGDKKYLYDSSGMRLPSKYPVKDKNGIWHIGLGIIKMKDLHSDPSGNGGSHYVLSMDYNFWMLQSHVKNVAKKGTPLWNNFYSEVKDSYLDYFNKNYEGNHAPVVIGHHFSLWNDGVYWDAMKSFAEDVCGKPKVKCVTFREYTDYLNSVVK